MRTDDLGGVMGALGLIEDDMAASEHEYAAASGWMAEWEHWHRHEYLITRETLKASGVWEKGTTETQKKDDIEFALQQAHPAKYAELQEMARKKAIGDKLFASRDARRSIGQTLMKPHLADANPQHGQEAWGQQGTVAA